MADATSGGSSGDSGNSGRSRQTNQSRHRRISKGSSSRSPGSNSGSSWARRYWPSSGDSLGNSIETYETRDEDREVAQKAVAFVLNSTSKGVVSLCSEVSSILKAKRSLERTVALQRKELECLRSTVVRVPTPPSSLGRSSETQKMEPQTSRKPRFIHRSTSPLSWEEFSVCLSNSASQTEIGSISQDCSPPQSTCCSTEAIDFPEMKRKEVMHSRQDSISQEQYLKMEQENVKLKNELCNLKNELESLKRKGSLPEVISETQSTVKTVNLSTPPANQEGTENSSRIMLQESPSPRQMETLNQELELPHIPQANTMGQTQDIKLSMSTQQNSRKGTKPFSSPIKVSPSPPTDHHPIKPVNLYHPCQCIGCAMVLLEESQTDHYRQKQTKKKKANPGRFIISPRIGDHVVVRSYLTGVVRYIGPIVEGAKSYVGLHLDAPVGNHNGSLDGKHFFSCPPNYGAFVPIEDVLCITSEKPSRLKREVRPCVMSSRQRSFSSPVSRPVTCEPEPPGTEVPV